MRSSLISTNTSNEADRNRQVGGIFYLERLSIWLSSSRLGPGSEPFELLAEILHQVAVAQMF